MSSRPIHWGAALARSAPHLPSDDGRRHVDEDVARHAASSICEFAEPAGSRDARRALDIAAEAFTQPLVPFGPCNDETDGPVQPT